MTRRAHLVAVAAAAAVLALAATVAFVAFTSGITDASAATTPAPTMSAISLQDAFVSVNRRVSPSVVQIETSDGLGSGIVFDGKGNIVTNAHVVGNAKTFKVTTPAGKLLKGSLVGVFTADDIAVIKVVGRTLRPATFGNSDALRVGDIAMAIGNPLGLQSSFTEGVVSALGRDEPEGNGVTLKNAIQTSAAINPGNSGGALVNLQGQVIGIPTLAANDPQLGGAAAGIGFAIPGNDVRDYATQIIAHGRVINTHRAYLGVTISETNAGVYISSVKSAGPAAKGGVTVGDVVTAVDGRSTPNDDLLGAALAAKKPGQTVTLTVMSQSGAKSSKKVTLGQYPGG
jgi:putative serine protease PepD